MPVDQEHSSRSDSDSVRVMVGDLGSSRDHSVRSRSAPVSRCPTPDPGTRESRRRSPLTHDHGPKRREGDNIENSLLGITLQASDAFTSPHGRKRKLEEILRDENPVMDKMLDDLTRLAEDDRRAAGSAIAVLSAGPHDNGNGHGEEVLGPPRRRILELSLRSRQIAAMPTQFGDEGSVLHEHRRRAASEPAENTPLLHGQTPAVSEHRDSESSPSDNTSMNSPAAGGN